MLRKFDPYPNHMNTIPTTTHHADPTRYAWADVMFLPMNPSVLRIARAVEKELAAIGICCGYLRTAPPDAERLYWGSTTDFSEWTKLILPIGETTHALDYTAQMLRGLQAIRNYNLRDKFGLLVTFIDTGWAPRVLAIACERQHIPTVLIQEGPSVQYLPTAPARSVRSVVGQIVRHARTKAAPQLFHHAEDGMHTQYACVYGSLKAASLVAQGKPAEKIFVTGNPLFDDVAAKRIPIRPQRRVILYGHQNLHNAAPMEVAWWKAIIQASKQVGARLIFKVHPRARMSVVDLRALVGEDAESAVEWWADGDIQDMITQADVYVTACSTSAYRAMVEGVPVVLLEGLSTIERLDLVDQRAALPTYTPTDLPRVLQAAFDEPQTRQSLQIGVDAAVESHLYRLDGLASQRVALALQQVLYQHQAAM